MRGKLNRAVLLAASLVPLVGSIRADAQEPRTGVTAGVSIATQYPDRFQESCGNPAALAPSVRLHRMLHRLLTVELGVSASIQMPPGVYCSADVVPLEDGDLVRSYHASRGSLSLSSEARAVVTPFRNEHGAVRLIGGGAWYPARRSPARIVGGGYRWLNAKAAFVFDVEYWSVGVRYDLERFRSGAPREYISGGREWQGFLQLRAGITVWSR